MSQKLRLHVDKCAALTQGPTPLPEAAVVSRRPRSCQAPGKGAGEPQTQRCVSGIHLAGFMFCFCWQNSLLKLQALESGLCSAFLTTQEEDGQVHGVKDPAPAATQSVPADSVDSAGKRQSLGGDVPSGTLETA